MAAHICTAFQQVLDGAAEGYEQGALFSNALSYARLGDCLENNDWLILKGLAGGEEPFATQRLIGAILALLPKYRKEWLDLGRPATIEEWMEAKYGD